MSLLEKKRLYISLLPNTVPCSRISIRKWLHEIGLCKTLALT